MSAPEEQTTLERIGRERAAHTPSFGDAAEEAARAAVGSDFNYGGRSERPDEDVAKDAARADPGTVTGEAQAPTFSSPLPDRAFPGGDLYDDARAGGEPPSGVPWREAKRGFRPGAGRFLRRLLGRN